jgi:ABC-type amino acid transport substrate-binding protein
MRVAFIIGILLMQTGLLAGQQMTMKVGVMHEPPFAITNGLKEYGGFGVDLWEEIAEDHNMEFTYVKYNDHLGLLRALDFHEIDIAINPIHVDEVRLKMFEVTQPFYVSSIGVATSSAERSQITMILRNFLSVDFLGLVMWIVITVMVFGIILWIAERRHNRMQFGTGWQGLFDGLWWSAVTITTVGYGDKAPKSKTGRTIAMVWMFLAIIIISAFTGTVASTLTVKSLGADIEQFEELRNVKKLGCVYGSTSEDLLKKNEIPVRHYYDSPEEALRGLANREIQVLLHDRTVLEYLISKMELNRKVQLLPVDFHKQFRSFLLPKGSANIDWINPLLVRNITDPSWQEILKKYELREE